ncbi:MAG: hypothetical protein KF773_02830 [Deltaproteobacteria bacterium]|nr:hypothetical protein [Deltaproteobacteria bacterium]MCW5808239.1 hypothetical protein [Deltaproteobacteria bacterium]
MIETDGADSSLLVANHSDFEIHELYVTGAGRASWGPNLLRGDVLFPGESMMLAIGCGTYDALLIDETNAACEVFDLDLCFDDADWIIRNNSCSLFEARAAEAAKAFGGQPATELAP